MAYLSSGNLEKLLDSFYVDNCLVSIDSKESVQEFIDIASTIMIERKFDLRGWEQTGETIIQQPTNVLGILWDKGEDTLALNIDKLQLMKLDVITKKTILSAAHRIFDPIGIASGVALIPKLLVQETWNLKLGWNEEVSKDIQDRFLQWMKEVTLLAQVKVPRSICDSQLEEGNYTLHEFSDASKKAYAAVVFLRVENDTGVSLRLSAYKARVSPSNKSQKGITIC